MCDDETAVRFSSENPYSAIVNHYGLDIEDEQKFIHWLKQERYIPLAASYEWLHQSCDISLEHLEMLYEEWLDSLAETEPQS